MKQRKNRIFFYILIVLAVLSGGFLIGYQYISIGQDSNRYQARSANTKYYDYSAITKLDRNYSYSSIFYSSETEFKLLKSAGTVTWRTSVLENGKEAPSITNLVEGDEVILLITKSGVNQSGELLDTVIKVNNIHQWREESSSIYFQVVQGQFLNSQKEPVASGRDYATKIKEGDLILFEIGATWADCDFTISYYKTGTVNSSGVGTKAGITHVNTFFYDIDVPGAEATEGEIMKGNEGFIPQNGASNIYYNKSRTPIPDSENQAYLQELDQGICIDSLTLNTNGIWYATSAFSTTSGLDSTYIFKYGGRGAGMTYSFLSPYPYESPAPLKAVSGSKSEYTTGDTFTYQVSQYVPNNYYGSIINFSEIYNNLYGDTRFTSFELSDTINSYLTINTSSIKVTDETETDRTSYFTITTNGQKVTATAKSSYFTNSTFYNHTYTLNIPVTIKSTNVPAKTVKNVGISKTAISSETPKEVSTPEVSTTIYFNVVSKYLEQGTNKQLASPITQKKYQGDNYTTSVSSSVSNNYELISTPSNASGTINGNNIEVIYYYKLKDAVLKVKHLAKDTGVVVGTEKSTDMHWGDNYTTSPASDLDWRYELVETPRDASGVISSNVKEVIYYYQKKPGKIITKFIDEDTEEEITEEVIQNLKYGDNYTTEEKNIPKNYEYKRKSDNYTGTVEEDETVVTYYYKKKDSKLANIMTKKGQEEIIEKNGLISFTIRYKAIIKDYIGSGLITIVDYLPERVDASKSDFAGGEYDPLTNTITWVEVVDIDSYQTPEELASIIVEKEIQVYYIGVDGFKRKSNNHVEARIVLDNNEGYTTADYNMDVKIPGQVVIKYLEKETSEELSPNTEITDIVGETVYTTPKDIKGYEVSQKPESEKIMIGEGTTTVIYYYEKAKVKVTTDSGSGGTIIGDEVIPYGEDSTEDKIQIVADKGYVIDKVLINGEEISIPEGQERLTLGNFIRMEENKNIQVVFRPKVPNPQTGNKYSIFIEIGGVILVLITFSILIAIQRKRQSN